ncbi:MAG: hypothetical protein L3K26_04090 [Candidatus Hydrogenedentes bacterium]|nr:hypothetical protein [Candidatus Hydrogenedentota bacterium]
MSLTRPASHVVLMLSALLPLVGCGPLRTPEPAPKAAPLATDDQYAALKNTVKEASPQHPTAATPMETRQEGTPEAAANLTPALHARFVRGMTLAEAQTVFSFAPRVVGGNEKETVIYRWEDDQGTYFTARFEAGVLVTASRLRQRRAAPEKAPPTPAESPIDTIPVAEVAPGVYVPLERAIASSVAQPRGVEAPSMPLPDREDMRASGVLEKTGPTIAVAGAARRERQQTSITNKDSKRSYTPKAKLPEFGHSLHKGRYEIRLLNPTEALVTVGLRKDKRGQDLTVPPKGWASLKVDRGTYELYFLRDDDPTALYEAQPIAIDGVRVTDVEVHLNPDDVEMRQIDYGTPGQ